MAQPEEPSQPPQEPLPSSPPAAPVKKFPPPSYPRLDDPSKDQIFYSAIFKDDCFEYRYMVVPEDFKRKLSACPDYHRSTVRELRNHGVIIPPGWQNMFLWRAPRQAPSFLLRRSLRTAEDTFLFPPNLPTARDFYASPSSWGLTPKSSSTEVRSSDNDLSNVFDALERWSEDIKT